MNTVENTYKKVANTLSALFGTKDVSQPNTNNGGKPSMLEMIGMEARKYHLDRNEWDKGLQYTRALVNAEYTIQTEFKINGGKTPMTESKIDKKEAKIDNKIAKYNKKIEKLEKEKARNRSKKEKIDSN